MTLFSSLDSGIKKSTLEVLIEVDTKKELFTMVWLRIEESIRYCEEQWQRRVGNHDHL